MMEFYKRHLSKLKKGECRVIRIGPEAICEYLKEEIIENCQEFFGLLKSSDEVHFYGCLDDKTGDFIACVSDDSHMDFDSVIDKVTYPTVDSLYNSYRERYRKRYVSIVLDDTASPKSHSQQLSVKNEFNKKHLSKLKKGECRVIRIEIDAIYEYLREATIEHAREFFDLLKVTDKVHFYWYYEESDFLCCISDVLRMDFDSVIDKVSSHTAISLCNPHVKKYVSFLLNNV